MADILQATFKKLEKEIHGNGEEEGGKEGGPWRKGGETPKKLEYRSYRSVMYLFLFEITLGP
jgi:hypothetical protein